jgi:hypothetical protein
METDQHTWTAMARSGKTFHDAATRCIWSSLDRISPLINLLPGNVVSFSNGAFVSPRVKRFPPIFYDADFQAFSRLPTNDDWSRFNHNAKYVRTLSYDEDAMPWSSLPAQWGEGITLLRSLGVQTSLLPGLKKLVWKARTSRCFLAGFSHFLTRTVHTLSVLFLAEDALLDLPTLPALLRTPTTYHARSHTDFSFCLQGAHYVANAQARQVA